MATDNKYDRQLRLWGPQGQKLLNQSKVLLLNCEPSGVELLKNLVLPGIGHICIVDDQKICEKDLGNNFFVDDDHLNQNRAEVICKYLLEMNNDVQGRCLIRNPITLVCEEDLNFFKEFNLIIVNELREEIACKICEICKNLGIHFLYLYTNGLIGYVRVFGNNHTVIESKPADTLIEDLRILEPFKELQEFVESFDLKALDDMEHGHVPYVVLLIKVLNEWKKAHKDIAPSTFQEKSDFKAFIKTFSRNFSSEENFQEAATNYYKSFKRNSEIPQALEKIFSSECCTKADNNSSVFWILTKALSLFFDDTKSLPLIGKIPDMTSLTSFYVKLQNIYKTKAEADIHKMRNYISQITNNKISDDILKSFCENTWTLEWINYRTLSEENNQPLPLESFENDIYKWYLAIKGCQDFENKNKRIPTSKDKDDLEKLINDDLIKKKFNNILPIEKEIIQEITRYEGAHLHNIAAFIGGVGSQEAIKLLTDQFVPLNNTFIFNGIACESAVFEL